MAHPGRLVTILENPYVPEILNPASAAACLTLLNAKTTFWIDIELKSPVISWIQLVCGSIIVTEPCLASFAVITRPAVMPALDRFRIGPIEYPDKATKIVIQLDDIVPSSDRTPANISIDDTTCLELKGVTQDFWNQWRWISRRYPMAVDVFFTCDDVLMALPKNVRR